MAALDKTAEKVLLVVDENQALIGALTDGDIRRYILDWKEDKSVKNEDLTPMSSPISLWKLSLSFVSPGLI